MNVLRTDIERALDEIISQEEGMRFQGLAVVLGKMRWPELIALQRKKDLGLDAYAPAGLTPEKIGKGLAASITPTLNKISSDAKTAKDNFADLRMLLFVTPRKIGNADRRRWKAEIQTIPGIELHILEREEIITLMLMPENASLQNSFLHLNVDIEPNLADMIDKTRRAANLVSENWTRRTKGYPLIELSAVRLEPIGAETDEVLSLEQIEQALLQSRRIVLEGPAGSGKTTTLIQIAKRTNTVCIPFIIELPSWTLSHLSILDYIAGMPAFQAENLTPTNLAQVQQVEPFLLLLNGWNEISESNSDQATTALRDLERTFPNAGIIVATRTHHLTPPLPGAERLRLLRLQRFQRTAYLTARLGERSSDLRVRIDARQSLDELTRTPFILSEVVSLFEVTADIPHTKVGILDKVIRIEEEREEHRNALQAAPMHGQQAEYLKAIATQMTLRGGVSLSEIDARAVVTSIIHQLVHSGQIDTTGAPGILATLAAHHVLERVDYPQTAFQFEHQQLQEFYATLELRESLIDLHEDDTDSTFQFVSNYVNNPAWSEPLRMIAETFDFRADGSEPNMRSTKAGIELVKMALTVDLVFAGELAQLCGANVWSSVSAEVNERFRYIYSMDDNNFRQCALTAMLATGAPDFIDVIVPILSGEDQQSRLSTYRLWSDIHVSSLGQDWREMVSGWSEEARVDFVSELLYENINGEIISFAAADESRVVQKEAVLRLMWIGSDEMLSDLLESIDVEVFEEIALKHTDRMPEILKPKTIAVLRQFIESTSNHSERLRTAMNLIDLGETGQEAVVKDAIASQSADVLRSLSSDILYPALEILREYDSVWLSEWVAVQIAEDVLRNHQYWLPFATSIPKGFIEKYLQRLETEELAYGLIQGMTHVIAFCADQEVAVRIFVKLRELRRMIEKDTVQRYKLEWQICRQLETVFRSLPSDIIVSSILSSATADDPFDHKLVAELISTIGRSESDSLHLTDGALQASLRVYLISSVDLVLGQEDFDGKEKANLASSIAQVGISEDIAILVRLIRADIDRIHHSQAQRAVGDRGPLVMGGSWSHAGKYIAALVQLDSTVADQVLLDLLPVPEYRWAVADEMARDFLAKVEYSFDRLVPYDMMWGAREARGSPFENSDKRTLYASALDTEIKRLLGHLNDDGILAPGLYDCAKALATVDAHGSADLVLDVIALPSQSSEYLRVEAAERLLVSGVILPGPEIFILVDSVLQRTGRGMQDSDRFLLRRVLGLCPFIDDPSIGITKLSQVLTERPLRGYELRELITALGESRSEQAVDLLCEFATDAQIFEQCESQLINAFATLDTPRAYELLLGFIDPDIHKNAIPHLLHRDEVLILKLAQLAERKPEVTQRLLELCERDLDEDHRQVISRIMDSIGTEKSLTANLNLINDQLASPIPQGVRDQLEKTFIERRPYGQASNMYVEHARVSNDIRSRLFRIAIADKKRQKSALKLLGQIEIWRLEHGRPLGEPCHPDLASGQPWPPMMHNPISDGLPKLQQDTRWHFVLARTWKQMIDRGKNFIMSKGSRRD